MNETLCWQKTEQKSNWEQKLLPQSSLQNKTENKLGLLHVYHTDVRTETSPELQSLFSVILETSRQMVEYKKNEL